MTRMQVNLRRAPLADAVRLDAAGERLRLLHVHAHPDDESSKGAATTARYVAEGAEVWVATCTGGERGSILNPAMDRPDVLANIGSIRREEMARARDILGISQVWLGYVDSGLPEGDPKPELPPGCFARGDLPEQVGTLVEVIRRFRPHVLTTYDENGGYPHPDHIRCHLISVAAFEQAGDPAAWPGRGEPWRPSKLYYSLTFNRARIVALDAACRARGLPSPYEERLREWKPDPAHDARITTKVPCADFFAVRDHALIAHATQIDPEGSWFSVPLAVHQRAWPTEEFELVTSHVPAPVPEDDLFAGIPTRPGPAAEPRTGAVRALARTGDASRVNP